MAIGPVQLIVLGFKHPNFQGEVKAELERLRESDTVRVIDASSGYRGVPGEVLPIGAELRAGDRVLCARTSLLGEEANQEALQGIVLNCPTGQVPRLTVAVGFGATILPLDARLTP